MRRHGDETHLTAEEARGGRTMNIMRFVLLISVLLAICALALVWAATRASARNASMPIALPAVTQA